MSGLERTCTIVNRRGLHARAAAKLVKLAETFDADVEVDKDGAVAGGTSILGLMTLAASQGTEVTVRAEGSDAAEALDAVAALIARGFDEGCG